MLDQVIFKWFKVSYCFGSPRKTHEQFSKEVKNLGGNEYILLSKYKNNREKVKIKHKVCSYEYEVSPSHFIQGKRCPKCAGNIPYTPEEFKEKVRSLVGTEYTLLTDYERSAKKVIFKHNVCGNEFSMTPNDFVTGRGCPHCFGKFTKTPEQFRKEVYELVGDEYYFKENYINAHTKILAVHNKCGFEWKISPDSFLRSTRCPKCSFSKGETAISEWLDKNNIRYAVEYSFPDCRYEVVLRFDFAVFDNNDKIRLLIEYDGKQHFKPIQFGDLSEKQMIERLKETQLRDKIKDDYCKEKQIPLLRIPYTKFEYIDEILESALL